MCEHMALIRFDIVFDQSALNFWSSGVGHVAWTSSKTFLSASFKAASLKLMFELSLNSALSNSLFCVACWI